MKFQILSLLVLFNYAIVFSQSLDSLLDEATKKNSLLKSYQSMIEAKKVRLLKVLPYLHRL